MLRRLLLCLSLILSLPVLADDDAKPLFAASLRNADGQAATLAGWQGKALIVNFWARWCAPCRAEIPELAAAHKAASGRYAVIGIGIEDDAAAVRQFASANHLDYPYYLAGNAGIALMQTLGNRQGGLPFTVAIDRDGRIVYRKLGALKKADIDEAARLLAAAPAGKR